MSICEFYSALYVKIFTASENTLQLQNMLPGFALPDLYAAVIVFAVKASTYLLEVRAQGTYILYCEVYKISMLK